MTQRVASSRLSEGTMEPGDLYWTIIEPHWKRVTIYEGGDPFLRKYSRTRKPLVIS
jgi:hypothetical protein